MVILLLSHPILDSLQQELTFYIQSRMWVALGLLRAQWTLINLASSVAFYTGIYNWPFTYSLWETDCILLLLLLLISRQYNLPQSQLKMCSVWMVILHKIFFFFNCCDVGIWERYVNQEWCSNPISVKAQCDCSWIFLKLSNLPIKLSNWYHITLNYITWNYPVKSNYIYRTSWFLNNFLLSCFDKINSLFQAKLFANVIGKK